MTDKLSIFITGGSGLLALNWAIARRDLNNVTLGLHERTVSLKGVNTRKCSLDTVSEIKKAIESIQPKLVIHAAGLTNVEACEQNPELAYYLNVKLAENVSKACLMSNVPLVHISTDHLFDGDNPMVDESHPVSPVNEYGRTKAKAELRILDINPDALIVRTNFYGWGPAHKLSFSDVIINSLREEKSISLFKDVFYTPILIETLVNITHSLIERSARGIYNIVGDERVSKFDFGLRLAKCFQLDRHLINESRLQDIKGLTCRPHDMSLSNNKVSTLLGIKIGNIEEQLVKLKEQEILETYKDIHYA